VTSFAAVVALRITSLGAEGGCDFVGKLVEVQLHANAPDQ